MKVSLHVVVTLTLSKGVGISFEKGLEVSLDCACCERTHRTVVFDELGEPGRCTPIGHRFEGEISQSQVTVRGFWQKTYQCVIPLSYEYQQITDRKYPSRVSSPIPNWARVHFTVTCPSCCRSSDESTQNNTVRPYTHFCECGKVLYRETKPIPTFKVCDA
jgi:hypothetical protein